MPHPRVEIAVLSDLHLGTRYCRADELIAYLDQLDTQRLILNGDVVDLTDMQRHWPAAHAEVLSRILRLADQGVEVHLLTGNHDGALRRFAPLLFGRIALRDSLILDLDEERVLFLHGDAAELDRPTHAGLHWLGGAAYNGMMMLGHAWNRGREWIGRPPISLLRIFKENLPCVVRHIARYEEICAAMAHAAGCDAVVCGHIHLPRLRTITVEGRSIRYRNSGDWVENASSLELAGGCWRLVDAAGLPIVSEAIPVAQPLQVSVA